MEKLNSKILCNRKLRWWPRGKREEDCGVSINTTSHMYHYVHLVPRASPLYAPWDAKRRADSLNKVAVILFILAIKFTWCYLWLWFVLVQPKICISSWFSCIWLAAFYFYKLMVHFKEQFLLQHKILCFKDILRPWNTLWVKLILVFVLCLCWGNSHYSLADFFNLSCEATWTDSCFDDPKQD